MLHGAAFYRLTTFPVTLPLESVVFELQILKQHIQNNVRACNTS